MSGSAFNHKHYHLTALAEEIEAAMEELEENPSEHNKPFSDKTNKVLKIIIKDLHTMAKINREVAMLFSGDIGEDEFFERLYKIGNEFNESKD